MNVYVPHSWLGRCTGFVSVAACLLGNNGFAAYETVVYQVTLHGSVTPVEEGVSWRGDTVVVDHALSWDEVEAALCACRYLEFPARGKRMWLKGGRLHRDDDLPAYVDKWSTQWFRHGLLHRADDLPAMLLHDGAAQWYQNGVLHRADNKPAACTAFGTRQWAARGVTTPVLHAQPDENKCG